MNNKRLFSIILVVFIDLLGFSLILPLLPYYAETFKASQTVTGILIASYALMQLIGAPILGRLSDRFGRRPVLLVSVFGTFLGFLLLGFANALWMLFASRILDGLTGGNLSVAQAYISDVTDEKSRSKGLGHDRRGVRFRLHHRTRHGRIAQPMGLRRPCLRRRRSLLHQSHFDLRLAA